MSEKDNYLMHHKYVRKYMKNGEWRYVYAPKKGAEGAVRGVRNTFSQGSKAINKTISKGAGQNKVGTAATKTSSSLARSRRRAKLYKAINYNPTPKITNHIIGVPTITQHPKTGSKETRLKGAAYSGRDNARAQLKKQRAHADSLSNVARKKARAEARNNPSDIRKSVTDAAGKTRVNRLVTATGASAAAKRAKQAVDVNKQKTKIQNAESHRSKAVSSAVSKATGKTKVNRLTETTKTSAAVRKAEGKATTKKMVKDVTKAKNKYQFAYSNARGHAEADVRNVLGNRMRKTASGSAASSKAASVADAYRRELSKSRLTNATRNAMQDTKHNQLSKKKRKVKKRG